PKCKSQSKVDENARQLELTIKALSAEAVAAGAKTPKVTLIGYSMGGAVIRSLFAGCPLSAKPCSDVSDLIDQVFFLDADQQGSWLLTINNGFNVATLRGEPGDTSIPNPITPYSSVLSIVQQAILDKVKAEMGLDVDGWAAQDQTPRSNSIMAHDTQE